jgi:hypothetical protein
MTPYQKSLAEAIETPEGMTQARSVEFTKRATLEENKERFQEAFREVGEMRTSKPTSFGG